MKNKIASLIAFFILFFSLILLSSFFLFLYSKNVRLGSFDYFYLFFGKLLFLSFNFLGLYLPIYGITLSMLYLNSELTLKRFLVLSAWIIPFFMANTLLSILFFKNNLVSNFFIKKMGYLNSVILNSVLVILIIVFTVFLSYFDFKKLKPKFKDSKLKIKKDEEIKNTTEEESLSLFMSNDLNKEIPNEPNFIRLKSRPKIDLKNQEKRKNFITLENDDIEENLSFDLENNKKNNEDELIIELDKQIFFVNSKNDELKEKEEALEVYKDVLSFFIEEKELFSESEIEKLQEEAKTNLELVKNILQKNHINLKLNSAFVGPVFTVFKFSLTNIKKIGNILEDIKNEIKSESINIFKYDNEYSLEISNKNKKFPKFKNLIKQIKPQMLIIGEDLAGNIAFINFKNGGHILIFGNKKTGKTNLLLSIMLSLLALNEKNSLKIIIIDFKENKSFEKISKIPILIRGLFSKKEEIKTTLDWIYEEIKDRRKLFKKNGVSNIIEYKKIVQKNLKNLVVFVDGFNILLNDKEMEKKVSRIIPIAKDYGVSFIVTLDSNFEKDFSCKFYFENKIFFKLKKSYSKDFLLDTSVLLKNADAYLKNTNGIKRFLSPNIKDEVKTIVSALTE